MQNVEEGLGREVMERRLEESPARHWPGSHLGQIADLNVITWPHLQGTPHFPELPWPNTSPSPGPDSCKAGLCQQTWGLVCVQVLRSPRLFQRALCPSHEPPQEPSRRGLCAGSPLPQEIRISRDSARLISAQGLCHQAASAIDREARKERREQRQGRGKST